MGKFNLHCTYHFTGEWRLWNNLVWHKLEWCPLWWKIPFYMWIRWWRHYPYPYHNYHNNNYNYHKTKRLGLFLGVFLGCLPYIYSLCLFLELFLGCLPWNSSLDLLGLFLGSLPWTSSFDFISCCLSWIISGDKISNIWVSLQIVHMAKSSCN